MKISKLRGCKVSAFRQSIWLMPAICMGAISCLSVNAQAQKKPGITPSTLVIYSGNPNFEPTPVLSSWGSGIVSPDTQKVYDDGNESLKIVTHGYYQGASLKLIKPVDLRPYVSNQNAYLVFTVFPPEIPKADASRSGTGGPSYGGGKGNFPGFGGQGNPGSSSGQGGKGFGSGGPGGLGGGSFPGGSGGTTTGNNVSLTFQKERAIENLRVVLVTGNGKSLEMVLPFASAVEQNGWKRIALPVSMIHNIEADDAMVKEIRVFGDTPGTINLGGISVIVDTTPLSIEPISDKLVQRLLSYPFRAAASGGVTPIQVTWDWDSADGIQEDAIGRGVLHAFRKESVYDAGSKLIKDVTVTVTVKDVYGIKKPVSTSFKVHVTP